MCCVGDVVVSCSLFLHSRFHAVQRQSRDKEYPIILSSGWSRTSREHTKQKRAPRSFRWGFYLTSLHSNSHQLKLILSKGAPILHPATMCMCSRIGTEGIKHTRSIRTGKFRKIEVAQQWLARTGTVISEALLHRGKRKLQGRRNQKIKVILVCTTSRLLWNRNMSLPKLSK